MLGAAELKQLETPSSLSLIHILPMVFTVILLVFPREKRGTAMGVIGLIIGFAPAVGPSVAGLDRKSVV